MWNEKKNKNKKRAHYAFRSLASSASEYRSSVYENLINFDEHSSTKNSEMKYVYARRIVTYLSAVLLQF